MKVLGWILTTLGCSGLTGTLISRNSQRYRLDSIAGIVGLDDGYAQTVDTLFYLSIGVLILGVILLVVGCIKGTTTQSLPQAVQHPVHPSTNFQANCLSCSTPVSGQFCPNCGQKVR